MSFTKITQTELNQKGAMTQPDRPTISAQDLKRVFDAPAKEVVAPAYNRLIDELEATTGAASLGAVAPTGRTGATVQAVINSVSGDLATLEGSVAEAIADAHTHSNKAVIDKLDDDGTGLTYDGNPVGAVTSVNSQTGDVVLSASDVGALPDSTTIPTKTSDLDNDSNFVSDASYVHTDNNYDATAKGIVDGATAAIAAKSTVAWSQQVTTGQKIATISINGTPTDVYAPTGGGGGGGAVDSVNGQTGVVVLNQSDINDVTITSLADQHTLVYNANSSIWENEALADVALTNSYNDLDNLPTIPTVDQTYSSASANAQSGVAVASAISGKADTSSLGDLAYIDIDGSSSTKVLQGDGTWVTPSTGGHDMIDNTTLISSMASALSEGTSNDDVVSAYGVGKWSNVDRVTIWTTVAQGDDTIGVWNDGWKEEVTPDRTGWIYHTLLAGILTNNSVDMTIEFDPANEEVVTLAGWRIDDAYTYNGNTVGCIAIKLNSAVKSASGVKVGVVLDFKRTEVVQATTIPS